MTTSPLSPRLLKGGLVLLDPVTSQIVRIIALQYNPDTVTRTLQVQAVAESQDRSEALRLKAPAVQTIKLDAEIDATDQLELPDQNPVATQVGIYPALAVLESLVNPTSAQLLQANALAAQGTLEIAPMIAPLALFVWSARRLMPVRITDFSITEEAFDPALNPIRAKVSLGMRVLTVNDLGFDQKGGALFMSYLQGQERLATMSPGAALGTLGITGIP